MRILQRFWEVLCYAGATSEEYAHILPDIRKNNHKRLQVFSCVAIAFLVAMTVVTYVDQSLQFRYQIYLGFTIAIAAFLCADLLCAKRFPIISKPLIILFNTLLALLAIAVGTYENPEQTAGTFLAFLLVLPLLFVMRPIENIATIAVFDTLFIMASHQVKAIELFRVDMINGLVFGAISMIVSSFMMATTVENFVIKDVMGRLAETDQLTQMRNRTSYERCLPTYPEKCKKSLACIYADANGLHELNEACGHEAGDNMLKQIGMALQEQFGPEHAYRIGGDEYVAFAVDFTDDELRNRVNAFIQTVEQEGHQISVGCAVQKVGVLTMSDLIKAAEDEMYLEKQRFYGIHPEKKRRHIKADQ